MPRIDPMKLLVCLSVLLAPNGGIRTAAEVKRLANLMAKFSKKLVSKCIYIQILKCTETDLLGQFMQTGGWALVHMWLVDGIGSKNWPLIQELLELLLCCPVDVERLKINSTPRLVKSLSTDSAHESVRLLATKLVEQWLSIVKAPKQPSSLATTSQGPSEMPGTSNSGLSAISDGKSSAAAQQATPGVGGGTQEGPKNGLLAANGVAESHEKSNGYTDNSGRNAENGEDDEGEDERNHHGSADDVDAAKKTFRAIVEHQDQPSHKKTSLVLKITTKNGKQVVAKVVTPSSKKNKGDEEEEDDEDEEEVLVNIESDKHPDEAPMEQVTKESKKLDGSDHHGSKEGSKERSSSSSSKDKDRHHRDHREKDRKSGSSSSSVSRSSSSKSSSSGGGGNHSSSSSSKHKSSSSSSKSSSSSSSSSRDKDKERHGSSSSTSSSSKHKSSSSSSASKSNGSSSKSGSSSSSSDKHRERSSHSTGNKDSKDSKGHSSSPNSSHNSSSGGKHSAKLSRKNSKDEGRDDSGSETSSNTTAGGPKSVSPASGGSSTSIPSKKASISIEVRNPENRPKTVKTYNSQFRSHGLIEEAPPPPSRKGLKKPSSSSTTSASSTAATSSATVGSTASGTAAKRSSSPPPSSGKEAVAPPEKKLKEDPPERPGSIKLIPPKRQHALVESDMFMDALSATLRKDVKKRKRRTSGSENPAPTSKPGDASKPDGAGTTTTAKAVPESPTRTTAGETVAVAVSTAGVTEATTPTTPSSPKPIVPAIAPMSFYRDTLAEEDENKDGENGKEADTEGGKAVDGQDDKRKEADDDGKERETVATTGEEENDEDEAIVKKPKRVRCELNEDEEDEGVEDGEKKKKKPEEADAPEDTDKTELMDAVMSDVEKKMAEEAEGGEGGSAEKDDEEAPTGKKLPGPGCGPDGPPGVLVIHRRKGPKKQLRWRVADELEEIRYFELDVTERCNVTKSFTDMKQMERVDERQKFLMARKVGSEDIMVEKTPWRPLVAVDNVPASPDGSQSVERNVQHQRERGCLQALYFNKHMIPDSAVEPEPADIYQTADPVHIPLEDVTGNPDSVNDFTSMPWPDPKSTPPHESAAFNSPFFPADLPPGGGFGPGGFPPPFPPGAAGAIGSGPAPWTVHARPGVLQPGLFPLNQPPPGMATVGGVAGGGGGGGSPNMLSLPPPGLFPGATNFNAPPPDLALMGDVGGRRQSGAGGDRGTDFRSGPPPPQQWVTGNGRQYGGVANNQRGGTPGYGNRGGGPGNWNRSAGSTGDRGRNGEEGRGNYRGHWMQNNGNRGHNNNRGAGGRKW